MQHSFNNDTGVQAIFSLPTSPGVVETSLVTNREKNTESLERHLSCRRPVDMLVDRGIYPGQHVPPQYAIQQKQLQMAKAGNILKHKIENRPNRDFLIQQNILKNCKIAPSLQNTQDQLRKAQLLDNLSEHLATRPGPLSLVCDGILLPESSLHNALIADQDSQDSSPTFSTISLDSLHVYDLANNEKNITDGGGKMSKGRKARDKRQKQNSIPKQKALKFHEFKGPTSKTKKRRSPARKRRTSIDTKTVRDSYSQRLVQQKLFLDYEDAGSPSKAVEATKNLELMDLNALQLECQNRNIATSDNKTVILNQLLPYAEEIQTTQISRRRQSIMDCDSDNKDRIIEGLRNELEKMTKKANEYKSKLILAEKKLSNVKERTKEQHSVVAQIKFLPLNGENCTNNTQPIAILDSFKNNLITLNKSQPNITNHQSMPIISNPLYRSDSAPNDFDEKTFNLFSNFNMTQENIFNNIPKSATHPGNLSEVVTTSNNDITTIVSTSIITPTVSVGVTSNNVNNNNENSTNIINTNSVSNNNIDVFSNDYFSPLSPFSDWNIDNMDLENCLQTLENY